MNTKLMFGVVVILMIIAGCGSDNKNETTELGSNGMDQNMTDDNTNMDDNTTERFTKMDKEGDTVEQDKTSQLEWVGSAGTGACKPHGGATTEMADIASATTHCDTLTFAGHDDWRVATAVEHEEYIKGMEEGGKTPFYANPACPRLIGSDGSTATAVNTHNSTPVGDSIPWATLLTQNATNFGVKCVRNQ